MVGCRNPITKCYFLSLMASRRSRRALSRSSLWLTRRACSAVLADASKGIFENQLLVEQSIFDELGDIGSESTLLDMGCGRGRIAQHAARATPTSGLGILARACRSFELLPWQLRFKNMYLVSTQ